MIVLFCFASYLPGHHGGKDVVWLSLLLSRPGSTFCISILYNLIFCQFNLYTV